MLVHATSYRLDLRGGPRQKMIMGIRTQVIASLMAMENGINNSLIIAIATIITIVAPEGDNKEFIRVLLYSYYRVGGSS